MARVFRLDQARAARRGTARLRETSEQWQSRPK
ncbi:hypothetical protein BPC006_I0043 [Burkholderia pseudomallei BPC006]|nr:hypothetical protein BPC006_I0043 [Burkholderia pseudomallei BPC006]